MGLTLVTAPATYPITTAEAKIQCRVDTSDEDAYFDVLIAAATDYVEKYLGRSVATQTWRLTLDEFSDAMRLPNGPVQSVSSVKYDDADGVEQTLSSDVYTADLTSDPQWVVRNSDQSWPTTSAAVNSVRIEYVAGYSSVPASIVQAIKLLISNWYMQREAVSDKEMREVPHAVTALLTNYRSYT